MQIRTHNMFSFLLMGVEGGAAGVCGRRGGCEHWLNTKCPCIYIYTHMNTYQPCAAVSQLPAALRSIQRNDALDLFSTYNIYNNYIYIYIYTYIDFFGGGGISSGFSTVRYV